jgi:hypothetical protein
LGRHPVISLACAVLLGATGCKPVDACAETGPACGGDPVGVWVENSVCQDPALRDPIAAKQSYRNQPIVPGGEQPPELTSMDWCSSLQYQGPNGIRAFALPRDTPAVQGAALSYNAASAGDHTRGNYAIQLTSSARGRITYSASCLQRFGYAPGNCTNSGNATDFGKAFADYGSSLGGIKDTNCQDAGDGGCTCTYLSESDAAGIDLSGIWKADGHIITYFAGSGVLPAQVDFCVQGNQMTLWGHSRTSIFNFNGLRTMTLHRIVCGDGMIDSGEGCDPPDQKTCSPTCQKIASP